MFEIYDFIWNIFSPPNDHNNVVQHPDTTWRASALDLHVLASFWMMSYFRSRESMYSFFFRRLSWADI